MKHFMQTLFIAAAILAVPAGAQPATIRVSIPFQFLIGDTVLPAGDYAVDVQPAANRLEIRKRDGVAGVYTLVRNANRRGSLERGAVLFHKYGDTYIMRHVSVAGRSEGLDVPSAKVERELAKRHSSFHLVQCVANPVG